LGERGWFNRGFGHVHERLHLGAIAAWCAKLAIPLVLLAALAASRASSRNTSHPASCPDEDQGYAIIGVQLPDGASMERTKAVYTR